MNPHILKRPVITEKSYALATLQNVYTFEVERQATKDQIKDAVESVFGVTVVSVRTIMSQPTATRTGRKRQATQTKKTKKAVVKLKENQTIALFDIGSES